MSRLASTLVVAAALAAAVASFVAGRAIASHESSEIESAGWLQNAPAQIRQADGQFEQQAERLAAAAESQRDKLAAMLADSSTTEQQILEQANREIQSHAALVKAVAGHVVGLRSSLPEESQRQNLMAACAGSLQGQFQRRYRYRGGVQGGATWQGRGAGRGRMWRYRGGAAAGQGFAGPLQLTAQQTALLQAQDPSFNDDISHLTQRLDQAQTALLEGFRNAQTSNEQLLTQADDLAAAQNDLEVRVARHVAIMYASLSPQQRQTLARLVGARGIDAAGTGG